MDVELDMKCKGEFASVHVYLEFYMYNILYTTHTWCSRQAIHSAQELVVAAKEDTKFVASANIHSCYSISST